MKTDNFLHKINYPLLDKNNLHKDIGKLLVLAPHPDDESLGCGGLINMLCNSNVEVYIIFITDGSASHPDSIEFPSVKLAEIRKGEATSACLALGVKPDHILFFREKDSLLSKISESEANMLARNIAELIQEKKIQSLAMPWRRDPHADHIASYNIGVKALQNLPQINKIEYPIWLWKNGKLSDWPMPDEVLPFKLNISKSLEIKIKAINKHRSQLGLVIKDAPKGFVLTKDLLEPFLGNFEYFFFSHKENKQSITKTYFEKLYSKSKDPWDFSSSTYEKDKYKLSINFLGKNMFDRALEIGCSIGIFTKMLAKKCSSLLAIDISSIAVKCAKNYCKDVTNVEIKQTDIIKEFPAQSFDLITLCEVGYYFEKIDFFYLLDTIYNSLNSNGTLLLVHWTPFVSEYPLTGLEVHNMTKKHYADFAITLVEDEQYDYFQISKWQKD